MYIMRKLLRICLAQIFIIYYDDGARTSRGINDVRLIPLKKPFCEAHLTCLKEGKSERMIGYMAGRELPEAVANMTLINDMWINVILQFHYTEPSPACKWVFGEERNYPNGAGLNINLYNQTKVKDHVVVYTVDKEIRVLSNGDNILKSFACGSRSDNQIDQIIQQEMFRREERTGMDSWKYPCQSQGCSTLAIKLTRIQCAMKCQMDPVCRSFYYESQEQECIHAKYVDMLLWNHTFASRSSKWERFSRPTWILSEELRN
ncbi:hypothetical protein FGIG_04095 [Fasciola gigantica]|uniref:Apple domain-containing protein n=1 Tax=Fasciola gigantica TaxID=46835 RepID=A0A504YR04_FASGI|nr:hypothetical protein FGIG_04095 [Fasciola gigantica]